jgi:enoyl-CoA hydratase/carnithine racemase
VNKVVPHDEFEAEVARWADTIAANAPLAVRSIKRLFRHGLSEDFESHTHHVLTQFALLVRSADFREGMAALIEKRKPDFEGR